MKKLLKLRGLNSRTYNLDLKMKLSILFLFAMIFTLQANNSYSQKTKITLDLENSTVGAAINGIESTSEFKFIFNSDAVNLNEKVSIKLKKASIEDALKQIFIGQNLKFEILDRKILLKKNYHQKVVSNSIDANAVQGFEVSGQILDNNGTPLPGASILEKGTSNGTQTDFDGNFSLNVSSGDATLVVSYIGFTTKEVPLNGQNSITITIEESAAALDEVVVIGYGTQKKTDLTGAVASVKPEDFSPGANTSAAQLLSGAAPGVQVSQVSSAPGGGVKIQIRGSGSVNSSNDVLFVVDGIPGIDPNSLSPDDIESIDVLKDASSAAIYGTRAANGVVLITTKKGKDGKTSLAYSSYFGMQSVSKQIDVLGAKDYMNMVNSRVSSPIYSDDEIANAGDGTNWQDEIFVAAPIQNHQLSLSGGSEKGNYYLGVNYFDQEGIVETSSNQKYNIRLNVQSRPIKKLLISSSVNFTRQSTDEILFSNGANESAGPINSAIQFDPTLPSGLDENGRYYANSTIALDNPSALINGITNENLSSKFYASLKADFEVVDNLTATVKLGAEANSGRSDFYRSRVTLSGLADKGSADISSTEYTHWLTEYLLKYENTFGEKHDFSLLGGASFEVFDSRNVRSESAGFLSDVTGTNLIQSGDGEFRDNVYSGRQKNQLNGFLGRMTYGFMNKYLVTASFRVDGSSRFSDKNKYGFFPSGSIGWRISQEEFLKESSWIEELKLRIGYGELGNQGINNFETRQTLVSGGNSVFENTISQGVVPARLPNPDLTWETTSEVNVGIDFAFFNNRLSGSVDYFNRKTKDQLFQKPLPSVVGFTSVRTNIGEVENKGVDFGLRSRNLVGNFKWNTSLNLSFLKNEVTELPDFTQEIIGGSIGTFINNYTIVREGDPLRSFYGYEINGIFQEGDDIVNSPTPDVSGYAAGMPKFVDQNGDGTINDDDRVVLGDPFPDVTIGFNNSFRFKNVSLDIFILGVQGIETLDANTTESLYPTNSARNSISRYYYDRWTPENPTNELPSGENSSLYGGARAINSLTIQDASFVRLKNITLGYDVPVNGMGALSSLRLYVAADNILTFTDYEGYDPDASASDSSSVAKVNYNSYPLARVIRLGLDVKF